MTLHNRKKYRATVVGTDRSHDLAVIQIKGPEFTPMVLGDSRNLQVGQKVYAIGNPFGLVRHHDPGHHQFDPPGAGTRRHAD